MAILLALPLAVLVAAADPMAFDTPLYHRVYATYEARCPLGKAVYPTTHDDDPAAWIAYVKVVSACADAAHGMDRARLSAFALDHIFGSFFALKRKPTEEQAAQMRSKAAALIRVALPLAKSDPELVGALHHNEEQLAATSPAEAK